MARRVTYSKAKALASGTGMTYATSAPMVEKTFGNTRKTLRKAKHGKKATVRWRAEPHSIGAIPANYPYA